MATDLAQASAPRARKALPEGYRQIERKVATLYPPVSPDTMAGILSNPGIPMGFNPNGREVRVRLGKIEIWERTAPEHN